MYGEDLYIVGWVYPDKSITWIGDQDLTKDKSKATAFSPNKNKDRHAIRILEEKYKFLKHYKVVREDLAKESKDTTTT